MIDMGGRRQQKRRRKREPEPEIAPCEPEQETVPCIQDGQDPDSIYTAECIDFAEEINWDWESVVYWWSQIALARQKNNREPQAFAEYMAMRNVREALDCRGRDAD